jgi:hypothetical protein
LILIDCKEKLKKLKINVDPFLHIYFFFKILYFSSLPVKTSVLSDAQELALKERKRKSEETLSKTLDALKLENDGRYEEFLKWLRTHIPRKYVITEDSLIPIRDKSLLTHDSDLSGGSRAPSDDELLYNRTPTLLDIPEDALIPLDEIPLPGEDRLSTLQSADPTLPCEADYTSYFVGTPAPISQGPGNSYNFHQPFLLRAPSGPLSGFSYGPPDIVERLSLLHESYIPPPPWPGNPSFTKTVSPIHGTEPAVTKRGDLAPVDSEGLSSALPTYKNTTPSQGSEMSKSTTITAAPQIRDMEKELRQFIPSSIRKKTSEASTVTKRPERSLHSGTALKKSLLPRVIAAPDVAKPPYKDPSLLTTDDAYAQFVSEMSGYL